LNRQQLATRNSQLTTRIVLSYFAFVMIGANDAAVGVLLPSMRAHYGVDKATVGLLFLAGTAGYLSAAFSSGLLVEKLGRRAFLALGGAVFSLGTLGASLTPPFALLLASILVLGFAVAIIDAGLNAYIASLPNNTALLNYLHAFYGTGALLGPVVATYALQFGWGWNSVYVLWVALGLLFLSGSVLLFEKRGAAENGHAHREGGNGNVMAAALRLPVVWLIALFLMIYVGGEVSLGSWGYSFLTEERREPEVLSGWAVSGFWLGLTLGRFLLARVAERIGNRRMIQGCLAGVIVGVFMVWLVPLGVAEAAGLWLAGFSLGPIFPSIISLMSDVVPGRLLPSAVGFVASFGAVGAALFPWFAGVLAEQVGLWTLLPYVIVLTVVMLALWLALQARQHA
jgi:fucose permease